jgi:hypothetical protein
MLFVQFLTVLVGLAVAIVAYAQWRTANQRVVLDLHEKRTKAFGLIEQAVFIAFREGEVTQQTFNIFAQGQLDARFVFGDEVVTYLKDLRSAFSFVMCFPRQPSGSTPYSAEDNDKRTKALLKITDFHDDGVAKFKPYMDLTQKNISFWRPW